MAAFAIVGEDGKSVSWIRDRQDLKKLLVRGYRLNAESIQRVDCALDAAFEDVIEALGRYPTTTLTRQEEKEFSWPRTTLVTATLGAAVFGPIGFGLLAGFSVGAIKAAELRNENARKNIARVIAGALLFGGLSTSETAAILIEQGIPEADVSQILQA